MTLDTRLTTAKARSQIINKHVWHDHGKFRFPPGLPFSQKYAMHQKLHEEKPDDWDHGHDDYEDLTRYWGHYFVPEPVRIRSDRQALKKWTITWHLANAEQHYDAIVGSMEVKHNHHVELHGGDVGNWAEIVGNWAGVAPHRHPDPTNLTIVELKGSHVGSDEE